MSTESRIEQLYFRFLLLNSLIAGAALSLLSGCSSSNTEQKQSIEESDKAHPETGGERPPRSATQASKVDPPLEAPGAYFEALSSKRNSRPSHSAPVKRGSVLLVVIDALNARHLSAYGYLRRTSPHIDRLAEGGWLMSNHVSNSSWTRPSFSTLITGLTKKEHGVELKNSVIDMGITTIAERFRLAGYKTAGFVGNPLVREIWGFGQGFQRYEDTASLRKMFPPDRVLADKAIDWLKTVGDDPFYLMIFFTSPHAPYRPLDKHFLRKAPAGSVIEYPFREYKEPLPKADHERIVAAYDDEVRYADRQLGRVLKALDELGRREDTAIIITADHGEAMGDHNCYAHTYHMWDSVLRVPLIVNSKALRTTGIHDDRPSTHIDLAPTLFDLAGVDYPPDKYQGVSLLAPEPNPPEGRDRIQFSQYNAHGIQRQAIRRDCWKLIHHHKVDPRDLDHLNSLGRNIPRADPRDLPSLATDGERYELYDLCKDPGELENRISAPEIEKERGGLMAALLPMFETGEDDQGLSPEMIEALENAGYIGNMAQPTKKKEK